MTAGPSSYVQVAEHEHDAELESMAGLLPLTEEDGEQKTVEAAHPTNLNHISHLHAQSTHPNMARGRDVICIWLVDVT